LRCHNYNWLDNNVDVTPGINLDVEARNFPKVPESHPDKQSIKAYYLSVKHILSKIEKNPIFVDFLKLDLDSSYINKKFREHGGFEIDYDNFNSHFMFLKTSGQLTSFPIEQDHDKKQTLEFLRLSHHFQHFNLNFDELPFVEENLNCDRRIDRFPTMCLDFTDNLCVLKTFGFIKKDSVLYSIDIEKVPRYLYDSYKHEYTYKLNSGTSIGKNTNKLMKVQKGYCIYWPWRYTIQELRENKMFDFKVESTEMANAKSD
jgi:hypothetical protein